MSGGAVIAWTVSAFSGVATNRISTERGSGPHLVVARVLAADAAVELVRQRESDAPRIFLSVHVEDEHLIAAIDTRRPLSMVAVCRALAARGDTVSTVPFLADDL